jgi:malonyl-CoA O-methyltransferase
MTGAAPRRVSLDVAAAYDRWAGSYDSYDNPIVFMAREALRQALPDIRGETIVEIGCGTGANLAMLKAAGAGRLIGLDLSGGMLERARRLGVADELIAHDMRERTPLPDACADRVLFCLSLEHVAALDQPIAEAMRLVRPGGAVSVIEIHPFLSLGGAKAHFVEGGDEIHMPTYAHRFADYIHAVARAGGALATCLELRPADITSALPAKAMKRGAETPLVVAFDILRPTAAIGS